MNPSGHSVRSVVSVQHPLTHFGRTPDIVHHDAKTQLNHAGNEPKSVPPRTLPISEGTTRNTLGELVIVKVCPACRNCFEAARRDTRYCSGKCRQKAYRQRKKDKREAA